MIIYLTVKTTVKDLVIDYIDVILTNGRRVSLNWDESDIIRTSNGVEACYKGIHLSEDSAQVHFAELDEMSIVTIGLYSESEKAMDIYVSDLTIEENGQTLNRKDLFQTEDFLKSDDYCENLKNFTREWLKEYNSFPSDVFSIDEPDDTSALYDFAYDMKGAVEHSEYNPYPIEPKAFDYWYDEFVEEYLIPMFKHIAYETKMGMI